MATISGQINEFINQQQNPDIWIQLQSATTFEQIINIVHPDWSPEVKAYNLNLLYAAAAQGLTPEQYKGNPGEFAWEMIDNRLWQTYGTYEQFEATQTEPQVTYTTQCGNGVCVRIGSDNSIQEYNDPNYTPETASYTSECANGTCVQFDQNGGVVGTYPDPGYVEPTYGEVQYDQNGNAYQEAPNGQIHYTGGTAPMGTAANAPGWAGWGQEYQSSQQYNPQTGKIETAWNKTPMSAEATLAQAQSANQAGNWYDTALLQRQQEGAYTGNQAGTPGFTGQGGSYGPGYSTFVPQLVGDLVSNKQGYAPNYDLQSGQNAMNVTPSGWHPDWEQAYQNGQALPGGGYQTGIMSMQNYNNQNPSALQGLSGWFGTGFADTSEEDYYKKMYSLAPPSGYQGLSWR